MASPSDGLRGSRWERMVMLGVALINGVAQLIDALTRIR